MNSDNVIRPVFGRKPVEVQSAPVDPMTEEDVSDEYKNIGPLEGEAQVRAQMDLLYMLTHKEHANRMRDKLQQLDDVVFSLANFSPDKRSIDLRRQGLKKLSLQEICELVANLDEMQVRKQPSYLGALVLEHSARINLALSIMNEREG